MGTTSPADAQKIGLAQAVAQQGSAGINAFKQSQADQAAQQKAATDVGAARAGIVNAPTEFMKAQAVKLAEPYNTGMKTAGVENNALQSYMGTLQGAQGNYMNQLHAAVPLAQAQLDKAGSGANVSQMIQLLNLKNSQEDRQTATDAKTKAAADAVLQQDALNKIVNHPDKKVGNFAQNILGSGATTLPQALAYLNGTAGQADLKKAGIADSTEVRRLLAQYYDPETYKSMPPPIAAAAAQPVGASANGHVPEIFQPYQPSNVWAGLKVLGSGLNQVGKGLPGMIR